LNSLTPMDIISWIETQVQLPDTSTDIDRGRNVQLEPYQVDPIIAQNTPEVDIVCMIAPEQFGKSFCWQMPLLYKIKHHMGDIQVAYEEREKAADINDSIIKPLLEMIPEFREQLLSGEMKFIKKRLKTNTGNVHFSGAGADFTSYPRRDFICDEYDTWPLTLPKRRAQLENAQKRRRRFSNRGLGCLAVISSVKGNEQNSGQWMLFKTTSQGYWHLRCLDCGELAIPSHIIDSSRDQYNQQWIGGLQWAKDDNGIIIPESLRLQCPKCHAYHNEDDTEEMCKYGGYVHESPQEYESRGYLVGGLASYKRKETGHWVANSWVKMAKQRQNTKRSNEYELERTWFNSWCGVAMPVNQKKKASRDDILTHCHPLPDESEILAVVGAADTQENPWGWFWIIRGIDKNWNTYLLKAGFATSREELKNVFSATYCKRPVTLAIVDQGGTNADDVKLLAKECKNIWQYKGASSQQQMYVKSKTPGQIKLLLCDAGRLQIKIIRQMYNQPDRNNNYWSLPPVELLHSSEDSTFDYLEHLAAVRAGDTEASKRHQNWDCKGNERRDWFDCEKMLLVLTGRRRFIETIKSAMKLAESGVVKPEETTEQQTQRPAGTWLKR